MKKLAFATLLFAAHAAVAGTNALDSRFGSGGVLTIGPTPQSALVLSRITTITPLADGKFLVGGTSYGADQAHPDAPLAAVGRINADGTWDTAFGDHGLFVLPYGVTAAPLGGEIHHALAASDGSVIAVGGTFKDTFYLGMHTCTLVIGLDSNGVLQTGFGGPAQGVFCFDFAPEPPNGGTVKGHFEDVSLQSDDGFLLTTGLTNMPDGAVARFVAGGTLDAAFGDSGVATVPFRSWLLARQNDGNTLVVGGNDSLYVTRIGASGAIDPGYGAAGILKFDTYTDGTFTNPMSARVDAQQRLLLSDTDIGASNSAPYRIGRVDSDGILDSTFNGAQQQPGSAGFASLPITEGSYDGIVDAFPLSDGRVFALGNGSESSGSTTSYFILAARLNADAGFDSAFGDSAHPGWTKLVVGSNALGVGTRVAAADSAGRVVAATNVKDDNGVYCAALLRLLPDQLFGGGFDAAPALICPN